MILGFLKTKIPEQRDKLPFREKDSMARGSCRTKEFPAKMKYELYEELSRNMHRTPLVGQISWFDRCKCVGLSEGWGGAKPDRPYSSVGAGRDFAEAPLTSLLYILYAGIASVGLSVLGIIFCFFTESFLVDRVRGLVVQGGMKPFSVVKVHIALDASA